LTPTALRHGLISVAREKLIVNNQSTVKDIVYRYVTGQEFTLQVKSVVAAFGRILEMSVLGPSFRWDLRCATRRAGKSRLKRFLAV
jgi:hypothetical protein